ncbi:hypothetical protein [Planktomarina sp.]|uniref:hypothetical protein n=2 Tax=Planktomarina TaxID=1284657 RepID=UPI00288D20CA|nr:hypothetical protein [Planktomarina sp.]MDT2030713.1 hypothetical protein [Planktomarina sp.]MDT2070272.1 hypothetical protein [Planktomarina sp.]
MRIALSLMLLTALASCAPPLPITDYIMDARSANAKITTQPLRFDVITVRTFVAGNRQERPGARCHIFTPDQRLSAAFQTPAQVRVPLYRGAPTPINGYCRLPGTNLAARFTLEAVNRSEQKNEGVRLTVGRGGPRIGATISLRDRSKDRYAYPAKLRITLAP